MIDQAMMEKIARDLFSLKREYEGGRVVISHKLLEAQDFIRKFTYKKVGTFSSDDPTILDEARKQLRNGKAVLFLAHAERQEYELYQRDW